MVGWHHKLDGHEFEQALGIGDGQGSLMCSRPWGRKELDMSEELIRTDNGVEMLENRKCKSLSRVRLFVTHGLQSPWNSPGQNTGVGSLSLLQGIFPTQGSNTGLLHCRQILNQLSHKENRKEVYKNKQWKIGEKRKSDLDKTLGLGHEGRVQGNGSFLQENIQKKESYPGMNFVYVVIILWLAFLFYRSSS